MEQESIQRGKYFHDITDVIPNTNEAYHYFNHYGKHWHSYYEKAKKIYWYYQNLFSLTPRTDKQPPFKSMEEMELWCQFHNFMKKEFYVRN